MVIPLFEQGKIKGVVGEVFEIDFNNEPEKMIAKGFQKMLDNTSIGRMVFVVKDQ